jgi:hypothetical protein
VMHNYPDLTVSKFKQAMVVSPAVLSRQPSELLSIRSGLRQRRIDSFRRAARCPSFHCVAIR